MVTITAKMGVMKNIAVSETSASTAGFAVAVFCVCVYVSSIDES